MLKTIAVIAAVVGSCSTTTGDERPPRDSDCTRAECGPQEYEVDGRQCWAQDPRPRCQ